MRWGLALATVLAVLLAAAADASAKSRRIASLNLCTDQLLLMLVARERIATVTFLARDPATSYMADAAAGIPVNHGRLEEILPLDPDLVLAGRYTTPFTKALLAKLDYRVYEAAVPATFDGIRAQLREVAELLGEPERGAALAAEMDAKLARIAAAAGPRPLAALYAPRGYTQGRGTLEDSVLAAAGYRNLAAELGLSGSGVLPLELLLRHDPGFLVFTAAGDDAPSLATAILDHPALTRGFAGRTTVRVPARTWFCPGPMVADAVLFLAEARR